MSDKISEEDALEGQNESIVLAGWKCKRSL